MLTIRTSIKEFLDSWAVLKRTLPTMPKTATNPHFKNKYVPLDDWLNLHNIICNSGWALNEGNSTRVVGDVVYNFCEVTLSCEHGTLSGELCLGEAGSMKPQELGIAITYFRRYLVQDILSSTGELDTDGNTQAAQVATQAAQVAPKARKLI